LRLLLPGHCLAHLSFSNTSSGGSGWTLENPNLAGASDVGPPFNHAGVNKLYYSADGVHVWATSFKFGFWHFARGGAWSWMPSSDYLLEVYPHPNVSGVVAGIFRSRGCYLSGWICQSFLRVSDDGGASWNELSKQVIQVVWSTVAPSTIFFSQHYNADADYRPQTWYNSTLQKAVLTGKTVASQQQLIDHQAGIAYKDGVLLVAVRPQEFSNQAQLFSSDDDAATALTKAVFRDFFEDEIPATSYHILDVTGGSCFVTVRADRADRGDLYFSSSLERDFRLVLPNVVKSGQLSDFTRLASLRGVYMANAYLPPSDEVVTGITYDNGVSWDFINVPPELASQCNASQGNWCGMHLMGRSADYFGQAPTSLPDAVGLAIATGNVGDSLDIQEPDELSTFLTRDGGVSWKAVATGNNLYAMGDRGGVILWAPSRQPTNSILFTLTEGGSTSSCVLGALGAQSVYAVTAAPLGNGLRFFLLSESAGKHYIISVDFSSMAASQCVGEDRPNAPDSNYETWTPRDPDGQRDCLLGQHIEYVRRKPGVPCFNAGADIQHIIGNCVCEREDYECDDCYTVQQLFVPNSPCVPKVGTCFGAVPDPCSGGQSSALQTRGYRKIAGDSCVQGSNDTWAPVVRPCVSTTQTQSTSSGATTQTTTQTGTTRTTGTTSTATPTATPAPSNTLAYALVGLLLVVIVGGVVGFLVLRRNPAFIKRFGGRIPFVPKPADPYSTLGELETGASNFDEDF
jgi:hypothetical protein